MEEFLQIVVEVTEKLRPKNQTNTYTSCLLACVICVI